MSGMLAQDTIREIALGRRVFRAGAAIPQNVTQTLFTVSGGPILLTLLVAEVTVVINGATNNTKFIATPTVGSAVDMCATVDINALQAGGHLVLPLAVASAGLKANAGAIAVASLGQIIAAGTIGVNCSNATGTGSLSYRLFYVPLDPASSVVAA